MDKRVKLDHVLQAVSEGNAIGLRTMVNIIIGHPEETWADVRKSVRFLLKTAWKGCSDTAVMMFCPYPGSADFEALVAAGKHEINEAACYVGLSRGSSSHRSWNEHMSARQLRLLQLFMISSFYLTSWFRRPQRMFAFVKAQLTGSEDTYLDQMVRTKRKNLDPLSATKAPRREGSSAEPVGSNGAEPSTAPTADAPAAAMVPSR
jgi:anaerobic magnesium-protoporphyrin IX monomethyl ester cyclase